MCVIQSFDYAYILNIYLNLYNLYVQVFIRMGTLSVFPNLRSRDHPSETEDRSTNSKGEGTIR